MNEPADRPPLAGEAALAMYPFAGLRHSYEAYWSAVHRRSPWLPPELSWPVDVHASWRSPDLVVGYTCGWPLVTRLADLVQVVGTFAFDVDEAEGHTYRSVIVVRDGGQRSSFADATAAVNSRDSLSGWISLVAAVRGVGADWSGAVRWTGSHLASVQAVQSGVADVASIDSVSWAHVQHFHPEVADGVVVVGYGPRVPCLPVVAGLQVSPSAIDELRVSMAAAVSDPDVAPHAAAMRVRGFVPLEFADYLPVRELGGTA